MTVQKDCDGDCLSCNTDTYISCEKRINPNTRPDPGRSSEPSHVKINDGSDREWRNCMCNKYTNCMDCQQHDNDIQNAILDKIDKELATRVTAANERAKKMQGAGYAYLAAGDQHEGLCLSSMRDYIRNECRPKEQP
jgi:hypothetical protein